MRRNIALHVVLSFRWSISQLLSVVMIIDGVRPVFLQRMTLKLSVARCSITTFILSTPWVRTCIGCSRKAFLPLSMRSSPEQPSWLPTVARGWVVEELLEAVCRCLYCNNTFVRILWIHLCHLPKVHVHCSLWLLSRCREWSLLFSACPQSPGAR